VETSLVEVNGANLWYKITGSGEPVLQIHGGGFNHRNFEPVTPVLAEQFQVIDYDQRGYGLSDRPRQEYDIEVWADDAAGLLSALGIEKAHIHGTSMGGMIAIVVAGKYPELSLSTIINCAAAKLGTKSRLAFKNLIDIALLNVDGDGVGSRLFAECGVWQGRSKAYLAESAEEAIETTMRLMGDNEIEMFVRGFEAMRQMDIADWLPRITSPTLVINGDEDFYQTPWNQGPDGVGMQDIFERIVNSEKHVVPNANHTSIFDNPADYNEAVLAFLQRHRRDAR
jgi:pimeloyl-ACP methyl ester carboxylesterase